MGKVTAAAQKAKFDADQAEAIERKKAEGRVAVEKQKQREAQIKRLQPMFDMSILPRLFPDVEWAIVDVGDKHLIVQEVGDDSMFAPAFRVTSAGVWIDYQRYRDGYQGQGYYESAEWKIESVLDVGKYISFMHQQMDESYRRNPD